MSEFNPFDFNNPVRDPSRLGGRKVELADSIYYVKQAATGASASLALIGARASGKSSLLNAVANEAKEQGLLTAVVQLDAGMMVDDLRFFRELFDELMKSAADRGLFGGEFGEQYSKFYSQITLFDVEPAAEKEPLAFGRIYAHARAQGLPVEYGRATLKRDVAVICDSATDEGLNGVCLVVDEADCLAAREDLLQALRNLLIATPRLMLVLAGTDAMFPALSAVFSPVPRQFVRVNVRDVASSQQTTEIIRNQLSFAGALWAMPSFRTVSEVHDITGGNPYEIVLVSHFMFKAAAGREGRRPMSLTRSVLDDVLGQLQQQDPRHGHASGLKNLSSVDADDLEDLLSLDGVELATYGLAKAVVEGVPVEDASVLGEEIKARVSRFASTGLIGIEDETVTASADHFAKIFLRYRNYGRRARRRRSDSVEPDVALRRHLVSRWKAVATRELPKNAQPGVMLGATLVPGLAESPDVILAIRAFGEADGNAVVEPESIVAAHPRRAVLQLAAPFEGVQVGLWASAEMPVAFEDVVARSTDALRAELRPYGVSVARVDLGETQLQAIAEFFATNPEGGGGVPAPMLALVEEFLQGRVANDEVHRVAEALRSDTGALGTDDVAWELANDFAFMSLAARAGEIYLEFSGLALDLFPAEPYTLITRALWHAGGGEFDAARDCLRRAREAVFADEFDDEVIMYGPDLLDRGDRFPRMSDVVEVKLGPLMDAYSAAFTAAEKGEPVAAAVEALRRGAERDG